MVFQTAAGAGTIDARDSSLLVAAVAISMLLTPLLLLVADRWLAPRSGGVTRVERCPSSTSRRSAPIIIAGFGRYGQIVGRLLFANGLSADRARPRRRPGRGGAPLRLTASTTATRRGSICCASPARERARVLVVAIDDIAQSLQLVDLAREHFPQLRDRRARTQRQHCTSCATAACTLIERETFDAALPAGAACCEALGWQPHQARTLALRFRSHNLELLDRMAPHFKDESEADRDLQGGPRAARGAMGARAPGRRRAPTACGMAPAGGDRCAGG